MERRIRMEIDRIISLILALGSAIASAFAVRKAFWESKHEESSTAETYEGMAKRAAERLDQVSKQNEQLIDDLSKLKIKVRSLEILVKRYEKGTNLLILQLEQNGYVPAWKPEETVNNQSQ